MIKSFAGKLYMLLSACQPFDNDVKRIFLIEEILNMREYNYFLFYESSKSIVEKYYSANVLNNLSIEALTEIKLIIPVLLNIIPKLMIASEFYNISELKETDIPDYYSSESITAFEKKLLLLPVGVNYTNIPKGNIDLIFDSSVLKSEMDLSGLTLEDLQNENLGEVFASCFAGRIYCFNEPMIIQRIEELINRS